MNLLRAVWHLILLITVYTVFNTNPLFKRTISDVCEKVTQLLKVLMNKLK